MIFSFSEFNTLLASVPVGQHQVRYRFQLETMLNTGMRYSELRAFSAHPEWHDAKNRHVRNWRDFSKPDTKKNGKNAGMRKEKYDRD